MNSTALTLALRRSLKLLHTLGAAGFMGGMAALAVVVALCQTLPGGGDPSLIVALARLAAWIVGPSMVVTVIAGLLAMAVNPAFYDAAWVWLKGATGVLVLEGGLHVLGPLQESAKRAAVGMASSDPAGMRQLYGSELSTLWVLLGVSAANIVLAIWRPRFRVGA